MITLTHDITKYVAEQLHGIFEATDCDCGRVGASFHLFAQSRWR